MDIEGGLEIESRFVNNINFRIGISDYEHLETEGSGEPGTFFENDALEARLLLSLNPVFGFSGTYGFQVGDRDFSAVGAEAFVPPVETQKAGFFWVGERKFGNLSLELGSRLEFVDHEAEGFEGLDIDFTNSSGSAGIVYELSEETQLSALVDITERAPGPEELFSNGPHIATQSFDIGDPNLEEERGVSLNLAWAYSSETFNASVSVYHNDFTDFIFQANTG